MSANTKIERLVNQMIDRLNTKFPGSSVEAYDASHDAYIIMTVSGNQVALIKAGTIAQLGNNQSNPVTGNVGVVYVPDVLRVGLDLGTQATDFFTMVGATGEGALAKGTLTGTVVIATNTVNVAGQTFTAVAGPPAAHQFQVGASDNATMANLAAAIEGDAVHTQVRAVAALNVVTVYSQAPGTGGNAIVLTSGQASIVASGAGTLAGGTAGSKVVINGVTFESVKHADYLAIVSDALVGPGTLFYDEGAGTAAQAAASVTQVINAATAAAVANVVTATVDSAVPAQVDLNADTAGAGGNVYTLTKSGTLVTSVHAATFSGGVTGLTTSDVLLYVAALVTLEGTEVRFYSKAAIAVTDLTNEALLVQTYRDTQWGNINQQ